MRRSLDKYMLEANSLSSSRSWVLEKAVRILLILLSLPSSSSVAEVCKSGDDMAAAEETSMNAYNKNQTINRCHPLARPYEVMGVTFVSLLSFIFNHKASPWVLRTFYTNGLSPSSASLKKLCKCWEMVLYHLSSSWDAVFSFSRGDLYFALWEAWSEVCRVKGKARGCHHQSINHQCKLLHILIEG